MDSYARSHESVPQTNKLEAAPATVDAWLSPPPLPAPRRPKKGGQEVTRESVRPLFGFGSQGKVIRFRNRKIEAAASLRFEEAESSASVDSKVPATAG